MCLQAPAADAADAGSAAATADESPAAAEGEPAAAEGDQAASDAPIKVRCRCWSNSLRHLPTPASLLSVHTL